MSSLLSDAKKSSLRDCVEMSNRLPGNLAEVGVYKGGSAEIINNSMKSGKSLFLFDTFEGLPYEKSEHDNFFNKGDFRGSSFDEIKKQFESFKNIHVFKGVFPEQNHEEINEETFSLVHLDVDMYKCTMDCLSFFYKRMTIGGIIVLDDYLDHHCEGVTKAVDKFFSDKTEKPRYVKDGQARIIKQGNILMLS